MVKIPDRDPPSERRAKATRTRLDQAVRGLGKSLGEALPPGVGFALLLFPFHPETLDENYLSYISNARREDILGAMKEFIAKWEAEGRPPDGPR
jgi:hypothetical protein